MYGHRSSLLVAFVVLAVGSMGCGHDAASGEDGGVVEDGGADLGATDVPDALPDQGLDGGEPDALPTSCGFDYDTAFVYRVAPLGPGVPQEVKGQALAAATRTWADAASASRSPGDGQIAYGEPLPKGTRRVPVAGSLLRDTGEIVLPEYEDNMPLFPRAEAWKGERRCYETPVGVRFLSEAEAYELYRAIAELTTGIAVKEMPGVRSVLGIRGAYPGRFAFHGNLPDRFNDTLVLLWNDEAGPHVLEFPVNTDTGAHDFGADSSSSLRPNRRYHYVNGWHRVYNALHIDEAGYFVMDDTNHNGHWDSDRNGWLPPDGAPDHERTGAGHNIHMGSVDAPLGTAAVDGWSAGCQVIPGMANWIQFITHAWTQEGDAVDYFLVDVRDIDPRVWQPCTPDGTHACPFLIGAFPFTSHGDTSQVQTREYDAYNCSPANESGPEVVYMLTVDTTGTLTATLDDVSGDAVDLDVHILDADDPRACLARGNVSASRTVGPGRYFIIVDTYVSGGVEKVGPYRLDVTFQ